MAAPTNQPPIRLERSATGVATLTLSRPEHKNVITHEFAQSLLDHCAALRSDSQVRAVLLRSTGPMFCAGADVVEMARHLDDLPSYVNGLIAVAHEAMLALNRLPAPIIACLQGVAAGGGASLALACDIVVAARSARLVMAYPRLGTTPDCGLSHSLSQRLGPQRALKVFLADGEMDASQAHALGLVEQVADDGQVLEVAENMAEQMAQLPPAAVSGAKRLFIEGARSALQAQLERERLMFLRCAETSEFRERVLAFVESRRSVQGTNARRR